MNSITKNETGRKMLRIFYISNETHPFQSFLYALYLFMQSVLMTVSNFLNK
jgi:hypothetical protein